MAVRRASSRRRHLGRDLSKVRKRVWDPCGSAIPGERPASAKAEAEAGMWLAYSRNFDEASVVTERQGLVGSVLRRVGCTGKV